MTTNRSTKFMIPKNELYYWDEAEQVMKPLVDIDGIVQVKGQVQAQVTSSDIMQPIDIQSHYQQTIQTQSASMIAPSGYSIPATYLDSNGFDKIAISLVNDATTACGVHVYWSHDGTTLHGADYGLLPNAVRKDGVAIADTKARYFKVVLVNYDTTAPHTMSAWAYLKA